MYMSYCKYEGTWRELRACIADAEEHINEEAEYKVSDREIECFKNMIDEFVEFLTAYNLINEDGYLDEDTLEYVVQAMSRSYGEM